MDDSLAQTLQDSELGQGPAIPQQPTMFKRLLMQRLGMGDPVQRQQENAYRQQLALQHFQEAERSRRKDAIDIAGKLKPALDDLTNARKALVAVTPFKGTPQYQIAAEHFAAAQATVAAIQQAAGSSWQAADAYEQPIAGMIAGMRMPQGGGAEGPAAPAGKGAESYERPSYASPSEPRPLPGGEPAPLSQEEVMAPNEASPKIGPELPPEPIIQGIPASQWEQGLAQSGFPNKADIEDSTLVYTVDSEDKAKHLQGILDDMNKDAPTPLPVMVRSRQKVAENAIAKSNVLEGQSRSIGNRIAFYKSMKKSSDMVAMIRAISTDPNSEIGKQEGTNFATIVDANEKDRIALIDDIIGGLEEQQRPIDARRKVLDQAWDVYIRTALSPILEPEARGASESPAPRLSQPDFFKKYAADHGIKPPITDQQHKDMIEAWNAYNR